MAAINARVEHGDPRTGAALPGNQNAGAFGTSPHDFGVDLVDAVFERVGGDVHGVDGIGLDVANERQAAQALRVASDGEGATDADFETDLRLRGELTFIAADIGHANNETFLR